MKKSLVMIAVIFCGLMTTVAMADDKPTIPSASVAPMQAISKLDALLGTWQLIVDMSFDDGKTWQSSAPQVVEIKKRHKDMMIAEYPMDLSSPGFHMETYITYDQYRQVYRKAAIDDMWGIMDLYDGTLEKGKLVFTNLNAGTLFPVGNDVWRGFRLTMELTKPNRKMTIEKSDDSGKTWQPAFVATYTLL